MHRVRGVRQFVVMLVALGAWVAVALSWRVQEVDVGIDASFTSTERDALVALVALFVTGDAVKKVTAVRNGKKS